MHVIAALVPATAVVEALSKTIGWLGQARP
jgi:hypothetical protein